MENLLKKSVDTLKKGGISSLNSKVKSYLKTKKIEKTIREDQVFRDVLFIDGCGSFLPHPSRYRVSHQREQLAYYNITSNEVFYEHLSIDMVRLYRTFIFFRCPYTKEVKEFIEAAKDLNKTILFDIDDLVIDTYYTDMIPYLSTMPESDRKQYNDNVMSMGKTLRYCDAAITTTTCLKTELGKYVPSVLINRNTASEEMEELSEKALEIKNLKKETVDMGYFSGSITHNEDFEIILPVLIDLLKEYNNLRLHIVGELDLPSDLKNFSSRIIRHPFVDWRKLPELIAQVDINLAPLMDTLFNRAKSENKWMEAALVQVVTVASKVGAFEECIENGTTGVLCDTLDEWKISIKNLIEQPELRKRIALNAYYYCKAHYLSYKTGLELASFIKKHLNKNILFVLPSLEISGGIMVALKHASILRRNGYDTALACMNAETLWYEEEEYKLPVLMLNTGMMEGNWDIAVATMWTTLDFVMSYCNIKRKFYLVQNYESDFYKPGENFRVKANATYAVDGSINYITISKWCKHWLSLQFGQKVRYAPNGICFKQFYEANNERDFCGKIKILIEGDSASYYKNVDESFKIVECLRKDHFEIWYMSYNAEPKDWYHVDKFFHKIPYSEVAKVYQQCDVLIKTSILESFSYPPLEMMAAGGLVLVVPNNGNVEYLKDGENCLLYEQGNIHEAVQKLELMCSDKELRHRLYIGGLNTAYNRDWKKLEEKIIGLYK